MALVPFPGSQPAAFSTPPDDDEDDDGSGPKMSFLEHLDELRKRIINALLGVVVGVFVAFTFVEHIVNFIWGPMRKVLPPGIKLIYTEPAEAFSLYIQISLMAGVLLAAPWVMYQVWLFISPGPALEREEVRDSVRPLHDDRPPVRRGVQPLHRVPVHDAVSRQLQRGRPRLHAEDLGDLRHVPEDGARHGGGLPAADGRLLSREAESRVGALPLEQGQIRDSARVHHRRVVTPTGDPINQTIFAAPIVVLYFLSIIIAWIVGPKRKKGPPV